MSEHVCPVWIGYLLASPIRKLIQNPQKILRPHVQENMIVLDAGSAMGFFSLPLAEMIKPDGKVICLDVQKKMLTRLRKRARQANLSGQIETVLASQDSSNLDKYSGKVDFALAFAVVHETGNQAQYFSEINEALKVGGRLLFSEPSGHVKEPAFEESLAIAEENGLTVIKRLTISRSYSALLEKTKV